MHRSGLFALPQFPPPGQGLGVIVGVAGLVVGVGAKQQLPILTPGGPEQVLEVPPKAAQSSVVAVFRHSPPPGQRLKAVVGVGVRVGVGVAGIQQFPKPRFPVQNWGVPPAATQRAFVL